MSYYKNVYTAPHTIKQFADQAKIKLISQFIKSI